MCDLKSRLLMDTAGWLRTEMAERTLTSATLKETVHVYLTSQLTVHVSLGTVFTLRGKFCIFCSNTFI